MKKVLAVLVSAMIGFSAALLTAPAEANAGVLDDLRSRGLGKWVDTYVGEDKNGKVYYKGKKNTGDAKAKTNSTKSLKSKSSKAKKSGSKGKLSANSKLKSKKLKTAKTSKTFKTSKSGKSGKIAKSKKGEKNSLVSKWKNNKGSISDRLAYYGIK